jgi:hypothetical protein
MNVTCSNDAETKAHAEMDCTEHSNVNVSNAEDVQTDSQRSTNMFDPTRRLPENTLFTAPTRMKRTPHPSTVVDNDQGSNMPSQTFQINPFELVRTERD